MFLTSKQFRVWIFLFLLLFRRLRLSVCIVCYFSYEKKTFRSNTAESQMPFNSKLFLSVLISVSFWRIFLSILIYHLSIYCSNYYQLSVMTGHLTQNPALKFDKRVMKTFEIDTNPKVWWEKSRKKHEAKVSINTLFD